MIYAIRAVGTNFIKIGYTSKSPLERVRELQTGCPLDLELVACCQGKKTMETWLHWRLLKAKAHHRGEWFTDCDEMRKIVAEIKDDELKPEASPTDMVQIESLNRHRLSKVIALSQRKAGGWR